MKKEKITKFYPDVKIISDGETINIPINEIDKTHNPKSKEIKVTDEMGNIIIAIMSLSPEDRENLKSILLTDLNVFAAQINAELERRKKEGKL
jgi:hypothetical protein